jgi:hypothetical protein
MHILAKCWVVDFKEVLYGPQHQNEYGFSSVRLHKFKKGTDKNEGSVHQLCSRQDSPGADLFIAILPSSNRGLYFFTMSKEDQLASLMSKNKSDRIDMSHPSSGGTVNFVFI